MFFNDMLSRTHHDWLFFFQHSVLASRQFGITFFVSSGLLGNRLPLDELHFLCFTALIVNITFFHHSHTTLVLGFDFVIDYFDALACLLSPDPYSTVSISHHPLTYLYTFLLLLLLLLPLFLCFLLSLLHLALFLSLFSLFLPLFILDLHPLHHFFGHEFLQESLQDLLLILLDHQRLGPGHIGRIGLVQHLLEDTFDHPSFLRPHDPFEQLILFIWLFQLALLVFILNNESFFDHSLFSVIFILVFAASLHSDQFDLSFVFGVWFF